MRRFLTSRLIWIYTVCHSVIDFRLKPLCASVDMSKLKDGRVHFRNSGMKRLIKTLERNYEVRMRGSLPQTDLRSLSKDIIFSEKKRVIKIYHT